MRKSYKNKKSKKSKTRRIHGGEVSRDMVKKINDQYPRYSYSQAPRYHEFQDFLTTNSAEPISYDDRIRYQNYLLDRLGLSNMWGSRHRGDSINPRNFVPPL
jgi:hypothetical protein